MNQLFGWDFWVVQQNTFYSLQGYEQVNLYKKRVFLLLVGPSEERNLQIIWKGLKLVNFQPIFD